MLYKALFFKLQTRMLLSFLLGYMFISLPVAAQENDDSVIFTKQEKQRINALENDVDRLKKKTKTQQESFIKIRDSLKKNIDSLKQKWSKQQQLVDSQQSQIKNQQQTISVISNRLQETKNNLATFKENAVRTNYRLRMILILLTLIILSIIGFQVWLYIKRIKPLSQTTREHALTLNKTIYILKKFGKKKSNYLQKLVKKQGLKNKVKKDT